MANCSSAYGHIEIKMEGAREMAELINKTLKGGEICYCTDVDLESPEENEPNYFVSRFWGCGRWAYEANCEAFWRWLKEGAKEQKCEDLLEKIRQKDFEIIFEFDDEEGGCAVLYEMTYVIKHKAGEDKVDGYIAEEKDYDYTPENLVELGIYDSIEDAREACGVEQKEER